LSPYRFNRIALALLFAVSASLHAQQVTPRDLPKPVKEIEDPFSMIAGALELKSGQVIMIDMAEMDLVLVDFTKGTRTILGRKGSGPGEYRAPQAMMVVPGDSLWVFDAGQMRFASWGPDMKAGATIPMMTFDQTTGTALTSPMVGDRKGRFYASSMKMEMGRSGGAGGRGGNVQMSIPDSVGVVRVDPRNPETRTELARVKFPVSGKPEMKQLGERNLKYTLQFPGLVAADAWAVFPDGRVAIVRSAGYTVEFIAADGKKSAPVKIAYAQIPVTEADKKAEMDEAQRLMKEQSKAVQKMMPNNITMEFEMLPPASWPATYPAVSPLGAMAAPDGRLWVKRSVPAREGREMWDVIDQGGRLVGRWRLPAKTTIVGMGNGAVYASRTDDDDFRYAQRIEIPKDAPIRP
jgi:hypothetical protein